MSPLPVVPAPPASPPPPALPLSQLLRQDLDHLAVELDAALRLSPAYARLSPAATLQIARNDLLFVVSLLEARDPARLAAALETHARQRLEQGFSQHDLLAVLDALENLLLPRLQTLDEAALLWPAFSQARSLAARLVDEITGDQRFRSLYEHSADAILILAASSAAGAATIVAANPAALQLFACPALDRLLGLHPAQLSPALQPDGRPSAEKAGEMIALAFDQGRARFEWLHQRLDGTSFPAEVSLTPLPAAAQSQRPPQVYAIVRDLTALKTAEQAVITQQEFFRTVADFTYDWEYWLGVDKHFLYVSPSVERITGYRPAEFHADPALLERIIDPEDQPAFAAHIHEVHDSRSPSVGEIEFQIHTRDGQPRWIGHICQPVTGPTGEYRGRRASNRDITLNKTLEGQLQDSLELFRSLFANSADAYLLIEDNLFVDCNQAAVEMLRAASRQQVLASHPAQLSPAHQPDGRPSAEKAEEMIAIALRQGSQRFEWIHRRLDGEEFPVEVLLTPITAGSRQVIFTVWRDVSARKRSEAEIAVFQALADNAADAILMADPRDTRLTYANRAAYDLFQAEMASAEMLGQPGARYWPPEDLPLLQALLPQALAAGWKGDVRQLRQDGQPFDANATVYALKDSQGQPTSLVVMVRDISERKRAEQEIHSWRERYDLLSSASGQLVYDYDILTGAILWSASVQQLLGFSLAEMTGGVDQWVDLIHPDDRPAALDALDAAQQSLANYDVEYRYRRKDGEYLWVSDRGLFLPGPDGAAIRMLGLMADITRRKSLEAEARRSLQQRGYQVEITTQIAQEIAAAADLHSLFERVVTLVRQRLDYYHVQILRYDPAQQALVLAAGYGEIGAQMLAQGHRLAIGVGLIGTAAASGASVLRPSLAQDPDWRPNPLLPETRGEIAVPIRLRQQLLGVLDVQSSQAAALGPDDQLLLEGLCGQIAVAIESTRLRTTMQERLQELAALQRLTSQEGWQRYFAASGAINLLYDLVDIETIGEASSVSAASATVSEVSSVSEVSAESAASPEEISQASIFTPLMVRGQAIGKIGVYQEPGRPVTAEEQLLIEQAAEQVAQALESARLFNQTQQALDQTRGLYASSARIIAASSLDEVLQALLYDPSLASLDQLIIERFDRPWTDQPPTWMQNAAVWERSGGPSREPVGATYPLADFPILRMLQPDRPLVVADCLTDPRIDDPTRRVLIHQLNIRGLVFWPLAIAGEWFGALAGQSAAPLAFTSDQIQQVSSLVGQAAAVIQGLRLQEDMRQRLQELTALQRLLSREAWLSYRPQGADLTPGYLFDHFATWPVTPDLAAELFSSSRPAAEPLPFLPEGSRSEVNLAAPLTVRGEPIGLLGLRPEAGLALSEADQDFLEAVSEQIAQALERARLIEQTQKSAVELQAVAEVGTATATILQPAQLLQQVVDLTQQRFGLYHAHIYLLDDPAAQETGLESEIGSLAIEDRRTRHLLLAAGSGRAGREMLAEGWSIALDQPDSLVAAVARTRQGRILADARGAAGFIGAERPDQRYLPNPLLPDTRSELAVPMAIGERLLGVFDVQSDQPGRFSPDDLRTYATLAAQVSVALQNANLYAEQLATVERLRELDNMKSAFLANMSHELRTPLNSILGFTQVILEGLDGDLTDLMVSDLELIEKNGKHLLNLINDILDMAKIEAGRLTLSPEPMSVYDLMDEVIITSAALARERGLTVNLAADPSADWMVMADSVRMRQIFINLIGNSIKFTERGGITVELQRFPHSPVTESEAVQIRIRDTGIGIPPEKLEEIFEAFSQVDSSTTRKTGGTGLGLPISRRLVEMHGGRLWAESHGLGHGSTFVLELPVGKAA